MWMYVGNVDGGVPFVAPDPSPDSHSQRLPHLRINTIISCSHQAPGFLVHLWILSHRFSDGHRFLAQLGPLKLVFICICIHYCNACMHDTILGVAEYHDYNPE